MTGTALTARTVVELPPSAVYGWRAASRLTLPAGRGVELLGRLSAIRPREMIVVAFDRPWRGRLEPTFDRLGPVAPACGSGRTCLRADSNGWWIGGGIIPCRRRPPARCGSA